jgi:hypothetical protein
MVNKEELDKNCFFQTTEFIQIKCKPNVIMVIK